MLVVAIAVIGSLTVLPAVLALLGDRVDRGRLPGATPPCRAGVRGRAPRSSVGAWARLARVVTRRPAAPRWSLPSCVLGALAVPAIDMQHRRPCRPQPAPGPARSCRRGQRDRGRTSPVRRRRPQLVVARATTSTPRMHGRGLTALGQRARRSPDGRGHVARARSRRRAHRARRRPDARPGRRRRAKTTVERLRADVAPTAVDTTASGRRRSCTGEAADQRRLLATGMSQATPLVIGFVLAARRSCCSLATFRSLPLAATVIAPQPALDRGDLRRPDRGVPAHLGRGPAGLHDSNGPITNWVPLFVVRDPVRALDGLHDPGARADPRGAARRPRRPRGRRRRAWRRPQARSRAPRSSWSPSSRSSRRSA